MRRNVILTAFKLKKLAKDKEPAVRKKKKKSNTTNYTTYVFLFRWKKINIKFDMTTLPDDRSFSAPAQLFITYRGQKIERHSEQCYRLCYLRDVRLNNITLKVVEMHKLTPTVCLYYIIHTLSSRHHSSSFTNCDLQHKRTVNSPAPLSNISPRA